MYIGAISAAYYLETFDVDRKLTVKTKLRKLSPWRHRDACASAASRADWETSQFDTTFINVNKHGLTLR